MAGAFEADIKSVKAETGEFTAVLSVPTIDRDGEILDARCFDPLPDHLTIDIDHACRRRRRSVPVSRSMTVTR
jgi:hypothetical protein